MSVGIQSPSAAAEVKGVFTMKKIALLLIVLAFLTTGVFAASPTTNTQKNTQGISFTDENDTTTHADISGEKITVRPILTTKSKVAVVNPFAGCWGFYLKVIIGALGGSLMLLRFATELVGAVIYEGEDSSSKVRQVIIRFLVHVGVAVLGFSAVYFIVGI